MEISKLVNEIAAYIKFVKENSVFLNELLNKIDKNVSVVREQLNMLHSTKLAVVPRNIIQSFPDVKDRVIANLSSFIDVEICEIQRTLNNFKASITDLEKINMKIKNGMSRINWNDYMNYYSAFTILAEWSETCWKYLHHIYLEISTGLSSFHLDDTHSAKWIKNVKCIDGINKDYIFNNPIIDMFPMLKKDFTSREKIMNSFDHNSKVS